MKLHELRPPAGATRERRRIGRGHGSGQGTTAGKGTKGQKARTGGGVPLYFEGGQLPLVRRLPYRRGFKNPFRTEYVIVNVSQLGRFPAGATINTDMLVAAGLLHPGEGPIKVLGDGELSVALHVRTDRVTRQAREKIEAAGGSVEELSPPQPKTGKKSKAKADAAAAAAAEAAAPAAETPRRGRQAEAAAPAEASAAQAPAAEAPSAPAAEERATGDTAPAEGA
jgi:large subunit ribosomal protein L15